eukprot:5566526-Karenia_brevis.AAC.1
MRSAILENGSQQHCLLDEVGRFERGHGLIPTGSRILFSDSRHGTAEEVLDLLTTTKEYEPLRIELRPIGEKRGQTLDEFGKLLYL